MNDPGEFSDGCMSDKNQHDLNVVTLRKGEEFHIFVFDQDAASARKLDEHLDETARDPKMNVSWFDVAVIRMNARKLMKQTKSDMILPTEPPHSR